MPTTVANLLLLLAGAIWGLGFIAQKTAMDDMGPLLFIGGRFSLAGIALLPFAFIEQRRAGRVAAQKMGDKSTCFGSRLIEDRLLPRFMLLGTVFFLGMMLQQIGLQTTTVTNSGFLTTLYVLLVPLIVWIVLGQQQPPVVWMAATVSVLGVYCLSVGGLEQFSWGDGLVLAGALMWAIHVILVSSFGQHSAAPFTMACTQFCTCAVLGVGSHGLSSLVGWAAWPSGAAAWWNAAPEILYAGLFSGGLAFTLQAIGQRYTTPSVAAILMASESLFAAALGAVLLGERLNPLGYVGCGLILMSIISVEWLQAKQAEYRERRQQRARSEAASSADANQVAANQVAAGQAGTASTPVVDAETETSSGSGLANELGEHEHP